MSNNFTHLHVHTKYSLLDGMIKIDKLLGKAKELGMTSMAITDHGSLFGSIDFYTSAKSAGIKPIIGCELYVAPNHKVREHKGNHLIALAQNNTGLHNLNKLVSIANREGIYYKPRVDFELLEEYNEGLIILSACLKGEVAQEILNNREETARKVIEKYATLFKDRYYLEIQENGLPEQTQVNEIIYSMGEEMGIPMVATNDCHYLDREDAKAHNVLMCVQTGTTLDDPNRMGLSTDEFYVKSPAEMADAFYYAPEAIANTGVIADMCEISFDLKTYHFPNYEPTPGRTIDEDFFQKARTGLEARWEDILINNPKADKVAYSQRLEDELQMIAGMKFPGYFMVVSDFINWAKGHGIPVGPGRGSAAGSLVAYCIKITDIDPIPYNLLFERFLNPERISMPDIDVDFCQDRREEVIQYVTEKYGRDKVSQIITFGTLQARSVIRDIGRVFNMPYGDVDIIAKLIPEELEMTIDKALKAEPKLNAAMERDENVKLLIEIAKKLEGLCRHASTHAAGVVITPEPIENYCPIYKDQKSGNLVTQYNMKWVEKVGLVKFDFLGLKNLTVIDNAVKLIRERKTPGFDISKISFKDPEAYVVLQKGDTTGVFQLESSGMKDLLTKLAPSSFEEIIAVCALYRPGPLNSGMVAEYVERKHGRKPADYLLPALKPVLEDTFGVIVYQEQVMQVARILAGYSLGEADLLRRAMGKKDKDEMAKHRVKFTEGAKERGVSEAKATEIFDMMEKFAEYGFNKSHSAAYALIAYQTAFLKAHYPLEFMCSLITCDMGNEDKVTKKITDCNAHGIKVLSPDVNESRPEATIHGEAIRFGFGVIKNVGAGAVEAIMEARVDGPFKNLNDFCKRVDLRRVNKRVIESLVQCGAFDSVHTNRAQIFEFAAEATEYAQSYQADNNSRQMTLFDFATVAPEPQMPYLSDWDERTRLEKEKAVLGFYCSGHPLNHYVEEMSKFNIVGIEALSEMRDGAKAEICGLKTTFRELMTRKGEKMAFATIEDLTGSIEVTIFPQAYTAAADALAEDIPLVIAGRVQLTESRASFLADSIMPILRTAA